MTKTEARAARRAARKIAEQNVARQNAEAAALASAQKMIDEYQSAENMFHKFYLDSALEQAKKGLAKFAAEVVKTPTYTFSWADEAMSFAAEHDLLDSFRMALDEGVSLKTLIVDTESDLLRAARDEYRSSSQSHNIMEAKKRVALVKALENLRSAQKCWDHYVAAVTVL